MTQPDASTPPAAPTPSAGLIAAARAWRDDDPDPITRAELSQLLRAAQDGDPDAALGLADRFRGPLLFGTAGLRGPLGAGPHRMNRAVVIGAAAGLTAHLLAPPPTGPGIAATALRVVIGYDARHRSADFAHDIAAVIAAAGGRALLLPRALPTPVLAFAVRHVGAHAGVMVTASHNPAPDNGIKVYLGDGAQIAAPADGQIARQIAAVGPISAVPRADTGREALDDTALEDAALDDTVLDAYLDDVAALAPADGPRTLSVVYTPLHGVGRDVLVAAFTRAGFAAPQVVATQSEPDPDFPSVAFPNPEEPGSLDAALEAARACGADLVLANDPDADRCAVAVPDPLADGGWRVLSGDEVGVLLGDLALGGDLPADAVLANSIVSSRQLAALCARRGVQHVETLTGFKWIARVPHLRYGYEEALGYCVDPDSVRDKDGVSAALLVATLAAALRNQGRTLLDRLDDLARQTGVHASAQHSVRFDASDQVLVTMQRLRATPPTRLGGGAVQFLEDLADGSIQLPATDGLRYLLADQSRVVVRPSGTEPKVKAYLEVIEPVGTDGVPAARARAAARLLMLHDDVARWIQPHRPGR